jgi:hypothetical protein
VHGNWNEDRVEFLKYCDLWAWVDDEITEVMNFDCDNAESRKSREATVLERLPFGTLCVEEKGEATPIVRERLGYQLVQWDEFGVVVRVAYAPAVEGDQFVVARKRRDCVIPGDYRDAQIGQCEVDVVVVADTD